MKAKYKGIIYILCAAFCFALMNTFVRLAGDIPSIQKAFFRNLVALFFAYGIMKKEHIKMEWKKGAGWCLFFRAFFGTIGVFCNFYAVDHLVLSDASMLNKMSPFFAIVFSYFILKERISMIQLISVLTAFTGCLFIIKPTFVFVDIVPAVIGLCGGLFAGIAYTMVRVLGNRGVKGPFIVFFFSTFSCLASVPFMIYHYVPMSGKQLVFLLLAGLSAAGGQFGITFAYIYAPAKEISIYDYSQVIFAAIFGYFLFGQVPDRYSFLGYVMICSMAVLMFWHNNRKTPHKI
ncbi:DMT family transporter [[Clostridium] polysaccharolyticum]|uniref:Permease of the drug/metabolite transporter (DMT) superfamily n=1 Tax=[Clostridium] polysaccharolyticum TaxID=29364 RepID=A0A1I0DLH9_9FIRM|nr:DMT family transporter [[Clostridium] polysaccharolyticum]SET33170.1 Permease of the drug/metabolite transporter (DMT) superfamily [[Clostridium] polysaccharolyticum]